MATISFTVPDPIAQELEQVAKNRGYTDIKALLKGTLKELICDNRLRATMGAVMAQADTDVAGVT